MGGVHARAGKRTVYTSIVRLSEIQIGTGHERNFRLMGCGRGLSRTIYVYSLLHVGPCFGQYAKGVVAAGRDGCDIACCPGERTPRGETDPVRGGAYEGPLDSS